MRRNESSRDPARVHAVTLAIWLAVVVALFLIWEFPRFFGSLLLLAIGILGYVVLYALVESRIAVQDGDLDPLEEERHERKRNRAERELEDALDAPLATPRPSRRPRERAPRRKAAARASAGAAGADASIPAAPAAEPGLPAVPVEVSGGSTPGASS
jgi:hypothetical protein